MKDFYAALWGLVQTQKELEDFADENKLEGEARRIATTVQLGQKLDILGFDSCVMGMLEVGYQFNDLAKTMIASEGSVPSAGWTYAKILGCLAREEHRNVDTREVAELFVEKFIRSQDAYTVGGVSVDMAAWDLSRFKSLAAGFDGLSVALLECFKDKDSRIYRQMARVILQVHWQCQSYMFDQNVDLGDFCELLDRECGLVAEELEGKDEDLLNLVQEQCRTVLNELREAVILSGFSGGGYQYSNGISVFFPWSREGYEVSRKNYESLWFVKEAARKKSSWMGFLKKYLYEVSLRKFEQPVDDVPVGARYRYPSGVKFSDLFESVISTGNGDSNTRISGQEGTKIAGQEGTRIGGQEGTRIAGQEGTRIAGQEGTRIGRPGRHEDRRPGRHQDRRPGRYQDRRPGRHQDRRPGRHQDRRPGRRQDRRPGRHQDRRPGRHQDRRPGRHQDRRPGRH